MATTFTRKYYDTNEQEMFDTSVKNRLNYSLDNVNKEHNNVCYSNEGFRYGTSEVARPQNKNGTLDIPEKVNVESFLQNRHLELSSYDRTNKDYARVKLNTPSLCNTAKETMSNSDTRLTHPIINYRGMYTAPYKFIPYLHTSPQDVVVENHKYSSPNRFGYSTRYEAKNDFFNKKVQKDDPKPKFKQIVSGLLPKDLPKQKLLPKKVSNQNIKPEK